MECLTNQSIKPHCQSHWCYVPYHQTLQQQRATLEEAHKKKLCLVKGSAHTNYTYSCKSLRFMCLKNYITALTFINIMMSPVYDIALINNNFPYEKHLRVSAKTSDRLIYNFSTFFTILIKLYLNGVASWYFVNVFICLRGSLSVATKVATIPPGVHTKYIIIIYEFLSIPPITQNPLTPA